MISIDGFISLRKMVNLAKLYISHEFITGRDESQLFSWPGIWPFLQLNDPRVASDVVLDNFEGAAQHIVIKLLKAERAVVRVLTPRGDLLKVSAGHIHSEYWPVLAKGNNPGLDPAWLYECSIDSYKEEHWKSQFLECQVFRQDSLRRGLPIDWRHGAVSALRHEQESFTYDDPTLEAMFRPYAGCPLLVDEHLAVQIPRVSVIDDDGEMTQSDVDIQTVSDRIVELYDKNPRLTKRPIMEMVAAGMKPYTFEFPWKIAVSRRPSLGKGGRR